MIELAGAIAGVLAVIGVLLNNKKMIGCFYVWIVSNAICCFLHWHAGMSSLVVRDVVFIVLSGHGLWCWGASEAREKRAVNIDKEEAKNSHLPGGSHGN